MSAVTLDRPVRQETGGSPDATRRKDLRESRLRPTTLLTALAFGVFAAVLRLVNISVAYDLFIDEATYTAIARDTSLDTGPMLHGLPFVLHPPIALLLLAGSEHVIGTDDVAGLRPFVALVGAITVAILFLALHRAGLRKAAYVAAALVALDPFVISFDSRVMLEAFAQLFAIVAIGAAIRAVTSVGRAQRWWAAVTALAGAVTFGTKETFGLVLLATLLLVLLTSERGRRRPVVFAVAGTLLGYALVNLTMIYWGGLELWWHMRTDGLFRLLGARQPTGFKAEGGEGSFWDRLIPNATEVGATYAILALGGLCALWYLWTVFRRKAFLDSMPATARAGARIINVWAVSACAYLGYAVVFGSLEEQMFYIGVLPCAAAIAIRLFLLSRPVLRSVAFAGVAIIMLVQSAAWVMVHTARDDVYAQMLDQITEVAPRGSTIAVTEETGQFVLREYELGQWATEAELRAHGVEYVLISERLVRDGYGLADGEFADQLREHGSLVLSVRGRESDLQLYDVRDWLSRDEGDSAATGDAS